MTTQIIVTEDPSNSVFAGIDCPVVDIDDYLTAVQYCKLKQAQVINLCHDYGWLLLFAIGGGAQPPGYPFG